MAFKFCPNLSFMYTEAGSLLDRYHLAKLDGFTAVECGFPYDYPVDEIKKVKEAENLEQVLINTYPGNSDNREFGFAAIPGKEKEFQNSINLALLYAKALNCKKIHVMSGIVKGPSGDNFRQYENNLKYVSKIFEKENIIGVIEPIYHKVLPYYFMNSFDVAVQILKSVNSPNMKLQLDMFHLQHILGNLTHNIINYKPYIGHIQIAQVPNRCEPDTPGEIDYKYIFGLLKELNYDGYIGLEYKPLTNTQSGLKWLECGLI